MAKNKYQKEKARENQDLAHEVVEKFTHALTWREPYRLKWDRFYKLYRSHLEETNYPWQSNLFIPYAFSTVETVVPRLVSNRPQIDILPREPNDEEHAKAMSAVVDYQWDQMGMSVLLPEAIKEMCIYGTVILKVFWDTQEEESVEEDPETDVEKPLKIKTKTTLYDGPRAEVVDLYDFFVDPRATSIDNARWVIHRSMRTYEYLEDKQEQGIYKNVELLKNAGGVAVQDDQKQVRRGVQNLSVPEDQRSERMIELLECWTDERVYTIADRKVVIRNEENPYKHGKKPFVHCVDQKVPHEFYGVGEIEPIESLQYELNDRRNQRMDNVTLVLNRMWAVVNGKNVDEDELVSDAGGVVHMDEVGAAQPFVMPDVTSSSYQEETLIKADIQQTSGVSDFTRGIASDALANDTATGISLLQEANNARLRMKVQNIEDMLIKRMGDLMVAMNEQYITDEQVIRIVGDDGTQFQNVKAEEIKGNFDVVVESGSTMPANEAVAKKQIMELYQTFAGDPDIDQKELKKMVLKAINPRINISKIMPVKEESALSIPGMEQPPEAAQTGAPDQTAILQSALGSEQPPQPAA